MKPYVLFITSLIFNFETIPTAFAKEKAAPPQEPAATSAPAAPEVDQAEKVNIDAVKKKYWARGQESELGVVQNRTYTKASKLEVGAFGGVIFSDPFLGINPVGFNAGFHLTEMLSFHAIYMRTFATDSTDLETFRQKSGGTANTNKPFFYYGGETLFSLMYGKLSLLGSAIIYYDLHLSGGVGAMNTESGTYLAPSAGIGQRFFISERFNIRVDYRMIFYREEILEKIVPTELGQSAGYRNNFSNTITFGIDYLFGAF